MICKNNSCKVELPDDATFCLKCGTKQNIPNPTEPTPNIQSDTIDAKPSSTSSKKKSVIITAIVFVLIACIAIGAVILAPEIIGANSKTSTTETTSAPIIETYEYPIEDCPIKVSNITVSYDDLTSHHYISAKWEYEPIDSKLVVDKVIFNFITYNDIGFSSPARYTAKGPFSDGVSYEEKWQSAQGSIDSAEIKEIEIYYTNNLIENYVEPTTETQAITQLAPPETKYNYSSMLDTLEDCPIKVNSYCTTAPNSADGVSFYIDWYSTDEKEIKYIYFTVTPYNRVNDKQYCEISDKSTFNGRVTGPFYYGSADYSYWECAWYNSDIDHIELDKITIEYMDGTKRIYYN